MEKTSTQPVRKITKVGGTSYCVTLPLALVRELKWREKQKVVVTKKGNKLIIEDWKE
jgi:antitoxin component of MazEF toxin-antitoxin module